MTGRLGWRRFAVLLRGLSPSSGWWRLCARLGAAEPQPAPSAPTKADRPVSDLLTFVHSQGG